MRGRHGNDRLGFGGCQPLLPALPLSDRLEHGQPAPTPHGRVAQHGTDRGDDLAQPGRAGWAMPEQRLAGAVEQDLIHAVTGDGLLADRLEIPEQSVQSALGVGGPLLLQVAQDRLGELPGRPHAVQVRAVDVGFPGRPFLFGELEAVCASALSNALAADGARKPEDGAVGAGDDLEGHRRLSIRWLMAISSNSTRRPALMTGGPCRATSRRRVRSASRRRAAVSAKVNRAGAVSGKTNSSWRAGPGLRRHMRDTPPQGAPRPRSAAARAGHTGRPSTARAPPKGWPRGTRSRRSPLADAVAMTIKMGTGGLCDHVGGLAGKLQGRPSPQGRSLAGLGTYIGMRRLKPASPRLSGTAERCGRDAPGQALPGPCARKPRRSCPAPVEPG